MTAPSAPVSASRVAKANAAYDRQVAANSAAQKATSTRYSVEHDRSERRANVRRMVIAGKWPELRAAIGWFKREWRAALPSDMHDGWDTVEPGDTLGSPRLNDRWRAYLYSDGALNEPIRAAMREMALADNQADRVGAAFLFTLACMDFEPARVGWKLEGHCACEVPRDELRRPTVVHPGDEVCPAPLLPLPDEYTSDYALRTIDRLRSLVLAEERRGPRPLPEPEWKARLGRSESQAIAEEGR